MGVFDQGQGNTSEWMPIHHERGFPPDLVDEAMALRVVAGAVDLIRKSPRAYVIVRTSVFFYHVSARANHEIHLESVQRA